MDGRGTVLLDSDESAPGLLQPAGMYSPTELDQAAVPIYWNRIMELGAQEGIPEQAAQNIARGVLDFYSQVRAAMEENESLQSKALKSQITPAGLDNIEANLRALPFGVGELLVAARLSDGSRLINDRNMVRWLLTRKGSEENLVDVTSEYDELIQLLKSNITEFQGGRWKGTNQTPSDRMLEIERERVA
jgi:hypothetical protein